MTSFRYVPCVACIGLAWNSAWSCNPAWLYTPAGHVVRQTWVWQLVCNPLLKIFRAGFWERAGNITRGNCLEKQGRGMLSGWRVKCRSPHIELIIAWRGFCCHWEKVPLIPGMATYGASTRSVVIRSHRVISFIPAGSHSYCTLSTVSAVVWRVDKFTCRLHDRPSPTVE